MSDLSNSSSDVDPLAGFSDDVRAAHDRWRESRAAADADVVILAIIRDMAPTGRAGIAADAPLTDELKLTDDLGYDSLAIAEVVFMLEDVYALRVNLEEIHGVVTIGDLRRHVRGRLGGADAG